MSETRWPGSASTLNPRQWRRAAACAAVVVVTSGALAGCRERAVSTSTEPAAEATASSTASVTTLEPPVSAGTGGPGTLTLSITSPVDVAGNVATVVACDVERLRYAAAATGEFDGRTADVQVTVATYRGPATYPALVTMVLGDGDGDGDGDSDGDGDEVHRVTAAPTQAIVTDTGGSLELSAQTDGGRTLAGSISWQCSAG